MRQNNLSKVSQNSQYFSFHIFIDPVHRGKAAIHAFRAFFQWNLFISQIKQTFLSRCQICVSLNIFYLCTDKIRYSQSSTSISA